MGWRDGLQGAGIYLFDLLLSWSWYEQTFLPRQIDPGTWLNVNTNSPRRGLTVVLTHTVPSTYVGQSDVEGVLCAGLQSHDVEETAIPCNLVGRVGGAVNENAHLYGWVIRLSQIELHTGMLVVLSSVGGAVTLGGTAVDSKPHE